LAEVVQEMEQHDSESKHSSKEKQMSIGRKKFNMDPKKGLYKILKKLTYVHKFYQKVI
jgi:cytohesin